MTKEQALQLIERLVDKTLSFGCAIEDKNHAPSRIMFVSHGSGDSYSGIQIGAEHTYNFFNGYKNPDMKILGHPVCIGDVLEKIANRYNDDPGTRYELNECEMQVLLKLWICFPLNSSLQTILEESECEEIFVDCISEERFPKCEELHMYDHKQTMLASPAKELFSFLDTLFPIK